MSEVDADLMVLDDVELNPSEGGFECEALVSGSMYHTNAATKKKRKRKKKRFLTH
jgi:hypothetical protein